MHLMRINMVLQDINCKEHILEGRLLKKTGQERLIFTFPKILLNVYFYSKACHLLSLYLEVF